MPLLLLSCPCAQVRVTDHLILANTKYDLFFLLGNEKYPMYKGLGRMNIYMCQFPFDLERVVDPPHLMAFTTYDTVLMNSLYSLKWYQHFIAPVLRLVNAANGPFPSFEASRVCTMHLWHCTTHVTAARRWARCWCSCCLSGS